MNLIYFLLYSLYHKLNLTIISNNRYIDIVAGLAVTSQGHIVAVDSVSPTVFVISETGDLLKWFDCSDHMREPSDIAINGEFHQYLAQKFAWYLDHNVKDFHL